jgi:hypothetical protein
MDACCRALVKWDVWEGVLLGIVCASSAGVFSDCSMYNGSFTTCTLPALSCCIVSKQNVWCDRMPKCS